MPAGGGVSLAILGQGGRVDGIEDEEVVLQQGVDTMIVFVPEHASPGSAKLL